MSVRETDGQISGGSPRADMTRRTTSRKGGPSQKLGAACSRKLRAPPPLKPIALARPHRRTALALGMSTTGPQGHAASSSTTGAPPDTSPGAPMEVEEEGAGSPEEEICFTGTTQTWPRIMMNRGSPADLWWVPVHGIPRAEEGATPFGAAADGAAGALAAAAPLLSSFRCIF